MELDEKNKYNPKVNIILSNRVKQKMLKVERNDNIKGSNLKNINSGKNSNKKEDIKQKNVNDKEEYDIINKNKQILNYSRKFNYVNIIKNNSNNSEQKIFKKGLRDDSSENIYNTIDLKNGKYNDFLNEQRNTDPDVKSEKVIRDKINSTNKANILKDDLSLKRDFNENNSIFNQIISRFKKFNENYQKFIKHTAESNIFSQKIKTKTTNKNDIKDEINNQFDKEKGVIEEGNKNIKLIKVNHRNKYEMKKNNTNFIVNKPLNKLNVGKDIRNKKIMNNKELSFRDISIKYKGNDVLSRTNDFLLNKINNRRNIKNRSEKSKDKNIINCKYTSLKSYRTNRTISYIPVYLGINSEKREFKTKKFYKKNKNNFNIKNLNFKSNKVLRCPKELNSRYIKTIENCNKCNKTFLMKKDNKLNNNSKTKKKDFIEERTFILNLNSTLDNDKKHNTNNSNLLSINTNSTIQNKCFTDKRNYEDENSIQNAINPNQKNFALKDLINDSRIKGLKNFETLNINSNKEYIKISENKTIKDSLQNNISFFDKNQNKNKSKVFKKMNPYVKPLRAKSKNKKYGDDLSKDKLLYKTDNNINELTISQLYKSNNSVEGNKNINDKINYIKKPILKKFSGSKKINFKKDVQEEEKNKNINNSIGINNIIKNKVNNIEYNINEENNENITTIQKVCTLSRFQKYYNYYTKIPIKNICFINKLRKHKKSKQYNDFEKIKYEGYEMLLNQRIKSLDYLKNGREELKGKSISNFYSKNITIFKTENLCENEIFLCFNNMKNSSEIDNPRKSLKRRSITEEKFALGCSKLNKILSKKVKNSNLFNGSKIDSFDTQKKIRSTEIKNQKSELNNNNNNGKENGGKEAKYKINYLLKQNSGNLCSQKNENLYYELKELSGKDNTSEKNTEEYFYNIHPTKKSKNKKSTIPSRKVSNSNKFKNNEKGIIVDKYVYEEIFKDLENYLNFLEKENNQKDSNAFDDINYVYSWKTIDDLMMNGKTKLEDIIKIYIEICKNKKFGKEDLPKINRYIKSIIEYYIFDFSKNQIEIVHLNMIELFKSLFETNSETSEIFKEILGDLLFILLKYKLYFMKDLNIFTEKSKETQINIAKIVKYSILASGRCLKQYHNDFKYTKLFNNNEIFVDYVTNEIPELNRKI